MGLTGGPCYPFHGVLEKAHDDFVGDQLAVGDQFSDRRGLGALLGEFDAQQVTCGQMDPAQQVLSQFTHCSFARPRSAKHKHDVGLGAGQSGVKMI